MAPGREEGGSNPVIGPPGVGCDAVSGYRNAAPALFVALGFCQFSAERHSHVDGHPFVADIIDALTRIQCETPWQLFGFPSE